MKARVVYFKWPLFAVASAGFLWAKKFGLHYTVGGDENAYFYMAKLMAGGKLFYRDFFFAHPPLQLLLLAAIYALFGFNFVLLKLSAALPVLLGAGFLYHQFWRRRDRLGGVFFLIVFLFNYELLKISTHPFGLNLTILFIMLSLYFFLEGRVFPCGLFWGLAAVTGLYALPWGLIPAASYFFEKDRWRNWSKFLGGFVLTFGAVNFIFILLFQEKYTTPVYLYHFLKPRGRELVADVFIQVIRRNFLLFFLPFLYIWSPKSLRTTAVLAGGLVYLLFLGVLNPLFTQYFMLPLPFLAWVGAKSLSQSIRKFSTPLARGGQALICLLLVTGFTADGFSVGGTLDNLRRYIIHERGTDFQNLRACTDFILENSTSGDLLFGHVTTVPLLALLTGRDIALDLVDTNHMRFKAGIADLQETLDKLEKEPRLKFFIIQESRFWLDQRVQNYLKRSSPAAVFEEPRERIIIFDCQKPRE